MLQLLGDFVPRASTLPGLCHWIPLVSTPSENLINPALATPMSVCLHACLYASISPEKCNGCASFSCIYCDEISEKFQENALALHDLQSVRVALSDTGY